MIRELILEEADEKLLGAWYRMNTTWKLENNPDEPVLSMKELIDHIQSSGVFSCM